MANASTYTEESIRHCRCCVLIEWIFIDFPPRRRLCRTAQRAFYFAERILRALAKVFGFLGANLHSHKRIWQTFAGRSSAAFPRLLHYGSTHIAIRDSFLLLLVLWHGWTTTRCRLAINHPSTSHVHSMNGWFRLHSGSKWDEKSLKLIWTERMLKNKVLCCCCWATMIINYEVLRQYVVLN